MVALTNIKCGPPFRAARPAATLKLRCESTLRGQRPLRVEMAEAAVSAARLMVRLVPGANMSAPTCATPHLPNFAGSKKSLPGRSWTSLDLAQGRGDGA